MKKLLPPLIYKFCLYVGLPINFAVLSLAYFCESYSYLFYPMCFTGIGLAFIIIVAYCGDEYFNKD